MTEYLTIKELSIRIKFSKQGIYNLIHKKILLYQVHYFKPTAGKLLFSWPAIQAWIEGGPTGNKVELSDKVPGSTPKSRETETPLSRIQI